MPGAVAGWVALSQRFGKLPFADLLQPAIELAERGYGVGVVTAGSVGAASAGAAETSRGFREAFMPRGRAPQPGERFRVRGGGSDAAQDRRDARRGVLPRRDRGSARRAQRLRTAAR